jgi:hypothetical protein
MKRFWIQRPCFYWGYDDTSAGKQISRFWLVSTIPPYYYGHGLRFRMRDRAYVFGLCRKAKKPFVRETEMQPEEIRQWH